MVPHGPRQGNSKSLILFLKRCKIHSVLQWPDFIDDAKTDGEFRKASSGANAFAFITFVRLEDAKVARDFMKDRELYG